MHLHEFLTHVHEIVKPKVYLEIGVQHGTSLRLAHQAELAIGIDPEPLCTATGNQMLYRGTSDEYFAQPDQAVLDDYVVNLKWPVDLAFIDGLHHAEQAMRDFLNVCRHLSETGVIVIDDVLPRNEAEANRIQCPGDWTGDVWKMSEELLDHPEVQAIVVDTQPTGVLVVFGATQRALWQFRDTKWRWEKIWALDTVVDEQVLSRERAWTPEAALMELRSMQ